MQLGFVSAIFPELSLEDVLKIASDEGFDCLELMCWPPGKADRKYAGVTHIDATNFNAAHAARTQELLGTTDISISALGYYPNILDADTEAATRVTQHLLKVIDTAALLNLTTVNTFIGADHTRNTAHNLTRFQAVWPDIIKHAESKSIHIAIENCAMLFTNDEWPTGKNLARSPAIWDQMFEAIPSQNLGLNYDPSHMVWQHMDHIQPLRDYAQKLFHIHAKDSRIDHQALNRHGVLAYPLDYHQPRIPGFGDINWPRFIATLREVGYDGPVCIEVEDETFPQDLNGRLNALRTARNTLQPYIY